jgi:pimeloyl-ACP methyl ester carboxylesterase
MKHFKILILSLIFSFLLISCASTPKIITDNQNVSSLASLETIELGGIDQYILMRSENINNPVILFLHGGPGAAALPLYRQYNKDLEKYFTCVAWDQRYAGKTFSRNTSKTSININQYIDDCIELVIYLKKRFKKEKVFLIGHSWGTILGMNIIKKYPSDIHAFISIGQVVDLIVQENISYNFALNEAKEKNNTNAIIELSEIGPPEKRLYNNYKNKVKDIMIHRKWVQEYGGGFTHKQSTYKDIIYSYFSSSEYNLLDLIHLNTGFELSVELLSDELLGLNLNETINEVQVPVYFIVGKYDKLCPSETIKDYYNKLQAPKKEFIIFNYSAHSPIFEEPELFNKTVINLFL